MESDNNKILQASSSPTCSAHMDEKSSLVTMTLDWESPDNAMIDEDTLSVNFDSQIKEIENRLNHVEQGWLVIDKRRFWFGAHEMTWQAAYYECMYKGGRLLSKGMRDHEEKGEIISIVQLKNAVYWIGLNDIKNEGTWIWSDGTYASSDEIPRRSKRKLIREDCATLFWQRENKKKLRGAVEDQICSNKFRVICEKDSL
ncbi:rheacalcin-2-like [Styela clava]